MAPEMLNSGGFPERSRPSILRRILRCGAVGSSWDVPRANPGGVISKVYSSMSRTLILTVYGIRNAWDAPKMFRKRS